MVLLSQILLLGVTAYQDFKDRAISWFLPILIFGLGIASKFGETKPNWQSILAIASFLILQITVLYLVLVIKHRSLKIDLTNDFLGWGDILFFLAMIPFFGFEEYVVLFVLGLIFSVVGHQIIVSRLKTKSVPLAGWLSIFYGLYFIVNY